MKLLFAGASDGGYYRTQRKLLAKLISDNHQIVIVSPRSNAAEKLIAIGCKFIDFPMQRHGVNPFEEIELIRKYRTILKSEKPDIVLTNTIKPNLYMGLLCRFMKIPYVMNITGLGEGLLHEGRTKKVILKIYPIATKNAYCIFFQNVFKRQFFIDNKLANPKVFRMLPGSGVDVTDYLPIDYPSDANGIRFMFVSRILKDKGIEELVKAFKIAKTKYNNIELHITGGCAEEYEESLKNWIKDGIVQYHGRVDDMKPLYGMMHCLIHPSYHEGMANVILESAACARPCLVSDINGCKEGVDDGKSGFVFPVKSVDAIVEMIDKFMALSNDERKTMGLEGRYKMEKEFNRDIVDAAYIKIITEIETRNI